jgi:hypothetical protein
VAPFVAGKNFIINGSMDIAQRSALTGYSSGQSYGQADRFALGVSSIGTWTFNQTADAPTGEGFTNCAKVLCTTASASPTASGRVWFYQGIEGQNLQAMKKGSSNALPITVSFWVKSNITGTYTFNIYDHTNNRHISKTYTINSSATWEKKSIVIPGDTTGTIANNNSAGLSMVWYLANGTDWTSGTLGTSWEPFVMANEAASNQANVASAINNFWQVTGVQIELGSVATPFARAGGSIGGELALCQRYYWRNAQNTGRYANGYAKTTTTADVTIPFPVQMRTNPSALEQSGTAGDYLLAYLNSAVAGSSVPTFTNATQWAGTVNFTVGAVLTAGNGINAGPNGANAFLGWSAEL